MQIRSSHEGARIDRREMSFHGAENIAGTGGMASDVSDVVYEMKNGRIS